MGDIYFTVMGRLMSYTARYANATLTREGEHMGRDLGIIVAEELKHLGYPEYDGPVEITVRLVDPR